jgi:hypothetical protein
LRLKILKIFYADPDPGSGIFLMEKFGSGINIPDPQHWLRIQKSEKIPDNPYFPET